MDDMYIKEVIEHIKTRLGYVSRDIIYRQILTS